MTKTVDSALSLIKKEHEQLASWYGKVEYNSNDESLLERLERAHDHQQNKEFDCLQSKVTESMKLSVRSEKEIVEFLKSSTDLKAANTQLDKEIEEHQINKELSNLQEKRREAGTREEVLSIAKEQQEFLVGLHGNLRHDDHSEELIKTINDARRSETNNHITTVQDIAKYASENKVLNSEQLDNHFKSDKSITEMYKGLRRTCFEHHVNLINHHMDQFHHNGSIDHANQTFECPIKYLEHWKNNVDHHLLPIKQINQRIEQEHERQLQHEHAHTMDLHM